MHAPMDRAPVCKGSRYCVGASAFTNGLTKAPCQGTMNIRTSHGSKSSKLIRQIINYPAFY